MTVIVKLQETLDYQLKRELKRTQSALAEQIARIILLKKNHEI